MRNVILWTHDDEEWRRSPSIVGTCAAVLAAHFASSLASKSGTCLLPIAWRVFATSWAKWGRSLSTTKSYTDNANHTPLASLLYFAGMVLLFKAGMAESPHFAGLRKRRTGPLATWTRCGPDPGPEYPGPPPPMGQGIHPAHEGDRMKPVMVGNDRN